MTPANFDNMPKAVRQWAERHPGVIDDAWTERGDYFNPRGGPEHWIYLLGWTNDVDPIAPIHLIHEANGKEIMRQLRQIRPCDCAVCLSGKQESAS